MVSISGRKGLRFSRLGLFSSDTSSLHPLAPLKSPYTYSYGGRPTPHIFSEISAGCFLRFSAFILGLVLFFLWGIWGECVAVEALLSFFLSGTLLSDLAEVASLRSLPFKVSQGVV